MCASGSAVANGVEDIWEIEVSHRGVSMLKSMLLVQPCGCVGAFIHGDVWDGS